MSTWCVVCMPKGVNFSRVEKEIRTQGRIFCVYEQDMSQPCWLSQSIPAIVAAINRRLSHPKRLHASSSYRVLRRESRSFVHKNHHIMVYQRSDLQELNELIATFPACIVVTQDPDVWFVEDESLKTALKPFGSSSEPKEPEADYEPPGRRSGLEEPEAV